MLFFDTHAHLGDDQIWDQHVAILERMYRCGVREVGLICTGKSDLERGYELQSLHSTQPIDVHLSAATGPNELASEGEAFFPLVASAAQKKLLKAIGEIGLDYHWQTTPVEQQKTWFIRYLQLALEYQLPIIIHCRRAFDDLIALLDQHYLGRKGARAGVFHCFSEGPDEAKRAIERGFLISFSGVITYKSAANLQRVAEQVPSNGYVIETDSPYLTPGKHRSKLNDPSNVVLVAEAVASCREESLEKVALDSRRNARGLFGLDEASGAKT